MRKTSPASLLLVAALAAAALAPAAAPAALAASDPTVRQIYQAAESGHLQQAQGMIDQVLKDHPNSAKAHYVAAELAAREGRLTLARAELAQAQSLSPGLPFARARSVLALKSQLGLTPRAAAPAHRFPWGGMLLVGSIIALVLTLLRRRSAPAAYPAGMSPIGGAGAYPGNPYGAGPYGGPGTYGPGGYGAGPAGGLGSGVMGGLASGLAVGAGVVAGEELAHRFLDGGQSAAPAQFADASFGDPSSQNADLGGNDFGIGGDPGSWDDSGGGGDFGGGDWS